MKHLVLMAVLFMGVTLSGAAAAEQTQAQCKAAFDSCEASCDQQHAEDGVDKARCRATCQASYAACDAVAAIEQAKPWVEEQWNRTRDFIDGLFGNQGSTPPPAESPVPEDRQI